MAGAATGAKRARAAAFSAHERYMHKSGVVLQREGKKIRAFLVRKVVAQLKQSREQHTQATSAMADIPDETKRKRAQGKAKKLYYQVQKLETELAALKTLDLKAVVARAFAKTGLKEDEVRDDDSEDERPVKMTAHEREMQKYGRGRVEKEEVQQQEEEEEGEDGFNSEDYDDVAKSDSDSHSDEESGDDNSEHGEEDAEGDSEDIPMAGVENATDGAVLIGPVGPPGSSKETLVASEKEEPTQTTADATMLEQLLDRVLAHNQMQPFLDAIRQYVAKREKEQAKKRRQKEKSALKRARASMIGGRSAAAPTSMFFGSLSGAGPDDDDDAGVDDDEMGLRVGGASMAGADDDIAEFLGETKKKKNRAGQMARRQKAIRMEEARRNEQNGGGFHKRHDAPVSGKYGPSERPKKQVKRDRGEAKSRARTPDRAASWQNRQTTNAPRSGKPSGETTMAKPERRGGRPEDSARGKPTAPKAPHRKPEAAPSHPSWLAKQALKEKMKVDITAFSGKKITFGDD